MAIHTIMSLPFGMCTVSTKDSKLNNSCRTAKSFILITSAWIDTEAKIQVYSISEGVSRQFCTRVELNCLRLLCLEQSWGVAWSCLNVGSSIWNKLLELFVLAVCSA